MKKQLLLLVMMLLPIFAYADKSGKCGDNLTWTLVESTGTLTISGSGAMTNYKSYSVPWYNDRTNILIVIIEDGVTSISEYAFYWCSDLTSVTIPNSVTSIGSSAFSGCSSLTSVTIPVADLVAFCNNKIVSLINYSIGTGKPIKLIDAEGKEIKEYIIPNSVTSIGSSAFSGCSSLTSVTIPNSVTSIGHEAFRNCSGLTSVTIPNSVTSIGSGAFYNCSGLTSVTIPNSVTSIGQEAFFNCSSLTSVTISNSVTSIGERAFSSCSSLTSISVENGNTVYDSRDNCNAIIETATNTLIVGCMNTVIPNGVTSIGFSAFYECRNLTSITIPNSVTSIGNEAFYGCSGLTSVHISSIEAWCKITFIYNFANPLYYAKHLYLGEEEIKDLVIPNSVTSIGELAFYGCSGLTSVTIGNSVTSIGGAAFYGCSGLTSVIIPNSVTTIGANAFSGCRIENVLTKNSKTTSNKAFSDRTYQHAMLYIPEGTWGEAIYDGDWYMFNNIRETTMNTGDLSPNRAYTLMDTNTFGYAVYDGTNDEVKIVKAFYNIDEQDFNNCWQVITQADKRYLYNMGAKKYATISADGRITLTTNKTAIEVKENDGGIIFGADTNHQWGFVKNTSYPDVTGIMPQTSISEKTANSYYSLDGQCRQSPRRGLNIVRMNDGTTKKIIVK